MRKYLIFALLVALAAGGFGAWYLHGSDRGGPGYKTAPLERGDISASISATGTIEPEEVVDVGAQVAGMILGFGKDPRDWTHDATPSNVKAYASILLQNQPLAAAVCTSYFKVPRHVNYGTPVEAGTILAQIDPSLYQAQVDQAEANLQKAKADLGRMQAMVVSAERDWNRAKNLSTSTGVISGLDYDTTRTTYETAKSSLAVGQAAVTQAEATLNQAKINLDFTTIRSKVKGVIVDRRVNIGQTVVSSLTAPSLFLIAKDLKKLQIWASVNEADIGQIHPGLPVRFTVDAHANDTFKGTVNQIRLNATMTQNVVTYTVVVDTTNEDGRLLPYMTANLNFEVSTHTNVLRVPNAALRWRPQTPQVAPDVRDAYVQSLRRKDNNKGKGDSDQPSRGTIWVADGEFVRPVRVHTGLNDGALTEITKVDKGEVPEKAPVVIGLNRSGEGGGGSNNPFQPKLFGSGKKGG
jgi:HlyD family secretion protein